MRILSGIQPSGSLHLGNYFAMMRRMIEYQRDHELFCFIVNYHALTTVFDAALLRENTFFAACDFISLGIDPNKSIFWVQSDVPEVTELTWLLANVTGFILRILPALMAGISWIASRVGGVGILLAGRHLSRTPGFYAAPLMLLVLTLSLSAFTASLAETLDDHLYDQMYYQVGADMRLVELGESTETSASPFGGAGGGASELTDGSFSPCPSTSR